MDRRWDPINEHQPSTIVSARTRRSDHKHRPYGVLTVHWAITPVAVAPRTTNAARYFMKLWFGVMSEPVRHCRESSCSYISRCLPTTRLRMLGLGIECAQLRCGLDLQFPVYPGYAAHHAQRSRSIRGGDAHGPRPNSSLSDKPLLLL